MTKNRKIVIIASVVVGILVISYFGMYEAGLHFAGIADLSGKQWKNMLEETGLVQNYKEKYPDHTREPVTVTDGLLNSHVIVWSAAVEEPPHIAQLEVTIFGGHVGPKLVCKDLATLETFAEYPVGSNNMKDTDCFG